MVIVMGDMLDNAGAQLVVSGRHQQYLDYASRESSGLSSLCALNASSRSIAISSSAPAFTALRFPRNA